MTAVTQRAMTERAWEMMTAITQRAMTERARGTTIPRVDADSNNIADYGRLNTAGHDSQNAEGL